LRLGDRRYYDNWKRYNLAFEAWVTNVNDNQLLNRRIHILLSYFSVKRKENNNEKVVTMT